MSTIFDDLQQATVLLGVPGLAGTGINEAEKTSINTRLSELEAGHDLGNHNDASGTPADGDTWVYDAAAAVWRPGTVAGSVATVRDDTGFSVDNVEDLVAVGSLELASTSVDGRAYLQVKVGGSGSSKTLARSDHTHTLRADVRARVAATGSLSGGTRPLGTANIAGLDPAITYVLTARLTGQVRGEAAGAGYSTPRIILNGNAVDMAEQLRTVAGVQVPFAHDHPGVQVSGVSTVPVSAALVYNAGDPVWVGGSDLIISIKGDR